MSPTVSNQTAQYSQKGNASRLTRFLRGAMPDDKEEEEEISQECLFCDEKFTSLGDNLTHMKNHGFSIPDMDNVIDVKLLMSYLFDVVSQRRQCLFCAEQQEAKVNAQIHMLMNRHCKLKLDKRLRDQFYRSSEPGEEVRVPSGKILGRHSQTRSGHPPNPKRSPATSSSQQQQQQESTGKKIDKATHTSLSTPTQEANPTRPPHQRQSSCSKFRHWVPRPPTSHSAVKRTLSQSEAADAQGVIQIGNDSQSNFDLRTFREVNAECIKYADRDADFKLVAVITTSSDTNSFSVRFCLSYIALNDTLFVIKAGKRYVVRDMRFVISIESESGTVRLITAPKDKTQTLEPEPLFLPKPQYMQGEGEQLTFRHSWSELQCRSEDPSKKHQQYASLHLRAIVSLLDSPEHVIQELASAPIDICGFASSHHEIPEVDNPKRRRLTKKEDHLPSVEAQTPVETTLAGAGPKNPRKEIQELLTTILHRRKTQDQDKSIAELSSGTVTAYESLQALHTKAQDQDQRILNLISSTVTNGKNIRALSERFGELTSGAVTTHDLQAIHTKNQDQDQRISSLISSAAKTEQRFGEMKHLLHDTRKSGRELWAQLDSLRHKHEGLDSLWNRYEGDQLELRRQLNSLRHRLEEGQLQTTSTLQDKEVMQIMTELRTQLDSLQHKYEGDQLQSRKESRTQLDSLRHRYEEDQLELRKQLDSLRHRLEKDQLPTTVTLQHKEVMQTLTGLLTLAADQTQTIHTLRRTVADLQTQNLSAGLKLPEVETAQKNDAVEDIPQHNAELVEASCAKDSYPGEIANISNASTVSPTAGTHITPLDSSHANIYINAQQGELYAVDWEGKKKYYAVLIASLEIFADMGIPNNTWGEGSDFMNEKPKCCTYNPQTSELQWASGYQDGGPLTHDREFPVLYFDGKFPNGCRVGWAPAETLKPFNSTSTLPYRASITKFIYMKYCYICKLGFKNNDLSQQHYSTAHGYKV